MIRVPKTLEKSCDRYKDIWSKKNELEPQQVSISNGTKYWFDCNICCHEYQQTPASKTKGNGCPYCSGYKLCGVINCLFCLPKSCYKYKEIWNRKNELEPHKVSISNGTKYWFNCNICYHTYEQSPATKTKGHGCPYCSNQKLCGDINCSFCLPKSCNIYYKKWSKKNMLQAHQVSISNSKKFWFNCQDCEHEYYQSLSNKTNNNRDCPFCTSKLCGNITCKFCLIKSCYKYKNIWSNKNKVLSHQVSISNGTKYWFNCLDCGHSYEQRPYIKTSGSDCPYCCNQIRCGTISCEFCLEKSCYKYKEIWSKKNSKKPQEVAISSGKKFLFNCMECSYEYTQSPNGKSKGTGCPTCVNKSERKVADHLKEIKVNFKKEFKINSNKRYDFYLPDFNLIIEIDGNQHFKQISNWQRCEDTIENDIQKMKIAIENGYSILRIYQPDIWEEKIDWKKIINDNLYLRKTPTICYQASVFGTYDDHLKIYRSVV